ncbi:MAG: hypothetical protein ACHQ50_10440 [Fimbriimonadales bacterium]
MSEETTKTNEVQLGKYGPAFAVLGLAGLAVTAVIGSSSRVATLHSYLFAVMLFMSATLGCFGLTLLQHVLQGKWGLPILRIFEAGGGVRNFLLMAVLFVPILYFARDLYPWARPEDVKIDATLSHRADHYLNWTDILVRFFFYFGAWIAYAAWLRFSVRKQEETGSFRNQQIRANWAAPGLVFIVLSVTFAYTDWIMALDPHWWSTMYPFWFISGMSLCAVSLAAVISCLNANKAPYNQIANKSWTNDIGNLMFVFTMLWGYTNLGQYIIIWHGNLPETTTYLVNRSLGHWSYLSFALVIGQFFVPFFALMSPTIKKTPWKLATVGIWILAFRLLDHFHVIEPFFRPEMNVTLVDLLSVIGVGGMWAWMFSLNVKRAPLFPTYDPRILEAEHAH